MTERKPFTAHEILKPRVAKVTFRPHLNALAKSAPGLARPRLSRKAAPGHLELFLVRANCVADGVAIGPYLMRI